VQRGTRGLRKELPWGRRPSCSACGTNLRSSGEWRDLAGRHLFRLFCPSSGDECSASHRRIYFDEAGAPVEQPRKLRRLWSPGPLASNGRVSAGRTCMACGVLPVPNPEDEKCRYCDDCGEDPRKAWRNRKKRELGPDWVRLHRNFSTAQGLKAFRAKRRLTQKELARLAGLSLSLVKQIERRKVPISRKTRRALLEAFKAKVHTSSDRARVA
jgi:DNA-binding XRE family transcriptional regulator